MLVMGETAPNYDAILLSSFETLNDGPLVSADDQSGVVQWKDRTGQPKTVALGPHKIRLIPHRTGR